MFYHFVKNTVFLVFTTLFFHSEINAKNFNGLKSIKQQDSIIVGANRSKTYLPLLKNKKIALVGNQTTVVFKEKDPIHLVDSLLKRNVNITKVFAPEHGFRGTASAGETIKDGEDKETGLPVVSLYGDHKKPTSEDLKNVDVLVFDIQDVGVRFYTYISTLHYIMEAAAEHDIPLLVFDRPNPNGDFIDGPILEKEHQSFVGMHPVPIVHGMTIGEYAQMINGEGWLPNEQQADLTVIKMKNYTKERSYSLPIKPSPNLPNDQSINLYPSLCYFEGTNVNAGRGTDKQFQVFGSPHLDKNHFEFNYTPESKPGAEHPKHEGDVCYGKDLTDVEHLQKIDLQWVIEAYEHTADKSKFFNSFFTKLAGTEKLQKQIEDGKSAESIRNGWKDDLQVYEERRQPYLLYR